MVALLVKEDTVWEKWSLRCWWRWGRSEEQLQHQGQPIEARKVSGGAEDDQGEQREMKVTIFAAVTEADSEDDRRWRWWWHSEETVNGDGDAERLRGDEMMMLAEEKKEKKWRWWFVMVESHEEGARLICEEKQSKERK